MIKALLVHRDGTLGFDVLEHEYGVIRKPVVLPLVRVEEANAEMRYHVRVFSRQGRAGPYTVYEERGIS